MSMYDRLKELIPSLADDGSKELAKQWLELIGTSTEVSELISNRGFQRILSEMREDFKRILRERIEKDPELREMRKMFVRTYGMAGAREQIERSIEDLVSQNDQKPPQE